MEKQAQAELNSALVIQGVLLFAFIPLVLFLYLRQPFGPGVSILTGVVIMFGHRFIAAPWMLRHANERCLWCGTAVNRELAPSRLAVPIDVVTGSRRVELAACCPAHAYHTARVLTFVHRYRTVVGVGIFVPLVTLLVGSLAGAAGHPLITYQWNTWQFRTVVAFTVVVTSLAWHAIARPDASLRSPFPLHNLFLLGIRNTLWVFRLVGAWWLVAGFLQLLP